MSKNEFLTIAKIADRAEEMNLLMFDRLSFIMDIEAVNDEYNLKLDELLNTDNFNFVHDICGIQANLNKETKKIENFFVPRFAGK